MWPCSSLAPSPTSLQVLGPLLFRGTHTPASELVLMLFLLPGMLFHVPDQHIQGPAQRRLSLPTLSKIATPLVLSSFLHLPLQTHTLSAFSALHTALGGWPGAADLCPLVSSRVQAGYRGGRESEVTALTPGLAASLQGCCVLSGPSRTQGLAPGRLSHRPLSRFW